MNTAEKWAWIRFGATASAFAYLLWKLFLIDSSLEVTAWEEVRDNLSSMLFVFGCGALLLIQPGKGEVEEDERDRAISAYATKAALLALTCIIYLSAIIVGRKANADLLITYPAAWFEHYLMACLALAWAIQSAVCVFSHWRDRR